MEEDERTLRRDFSLRSPNNVQTDFGSDDG